MDNEKTKEPESKPSSLILPSREEASKLGIQVPFDAKMGPANPYEWLQQRNKKQIEVLDRNMSVSLFISSVLDGLVSLCEDKKIPWESVELTEPFIADDMTLRCHIRFKV